MMATSGAGWNGLELRIQGATMQHEIVIALGFVAGALYIASHYIHLDHDQTYTASAGAAYTFPATKTRLSSDLIYGSGLRSGFANIDHVPSYTQVNLGLSHDFNIVSPTKPTTLRFDVVNLFDNSYQIRDGSGIGVFAPQYGPRRGFFFGISQKL